MSITEGLRPGDLVEVRSLQEIAGTLDENGCLEQLPFMPEMRTFAGRRFPIHRRLDKTCVEHRGQRRLAQTVTLAGLYCDGSAHDGCQRSCPLLWKEAWLKPVGAAEDLQPRQRSDGGDVMPALHTKRDADHYFCQSTELLAATTDLPTISWDRCTLEWRSGNVGLGEAFKYLWIPLVIQVKSRTLGMSSVQPVGDTAKTPTEALDLQPGEIVEVKQPEEIAATLKGDRNRGLRFTSTMVPFCGKRYTVRGRVDRMIDEISAEMRIVRNTVILDDVVCDGFTFLGGCSRLVFHLWREIWLRRV